MHRITREHAHYQFDRAIAPALTVEPGARITFETWDARHGAITRENQEVPANPPRGSNPLTGPVFVTGAEPGDELLVDIEDIALAETGWIAIKMGWGVLRHRVTRPATRLVRIEGETAHLGDTLSWPVRPMVGVIGTAPAEGSAPTSDPAEIGGNMDNNMVRVGTCVHLPVHVPGALFGLGDVHASMGDGEVTGTGIEICAEVTVSVALSKGTATARPWLETEDRYITCSQAPTLEEASVIACDDMADLLMHRWGLSFEDAFLFLSARGDVRISQACLSPLNMTARCEVPKLK